MWSLSLWNHEMLPLQWGVVAGASLAAAVFDISSHKIPNRLTAPLFASGLVWAVLAAGLAGLADATVACLLLAFPFVLLFLFAGGGAGDAKLMGALGAWLGIVNGLVVLTAVCVAGVVLAVCFSLAKRRFRTAWANVATVARTFSLVALSRVKLRDVGAMFPKVNEMQTMPYGIAIFSGVTAAAIGVFLWHF